MRAVSAFTADAFNGTSHSDDDAAINGKDDEKG
jgi:hypothetical protein